MAKRKLTDGYIIQLLRQDSGLSVEDIKAHPNLIEAKRAQIMLLRVASEKGEEN